MHDLVAGATALWTSRENDAPELFVIHLKPSSGSISGRIA